MEAKDKANHFTPPVESATGFIFLLMPTLPSVEEVAQALLRTDPAILAEHRRVIEEAIDSDMLSIGGLIGTDYAAFFAKVFARVDELKGGAA